MRKQLFLLVAGSLLAFSAVPAMAQENEEDGDYKALMEKTTNNANGICIDYLNSEHGDYSGDKMIESRPPDEVTKGLSKAIRDECQKHPKERVDKAVTNVRTAYARELAHIVKRMKINEDPLHENGGS
ncbi:hypothetical protein [Acetobacter ghanensis]|nr:hypothetical protein [Acetobacter ghanensis]GBQ45097.1 hypothetical protein AA18895_0356 [Acetobacter ghanensis DSM 18895]